MKTNYILVGNMSKQVSVLALTLTLIFLCLNVNAQTTVFIDDFNRAAVSPGGLPQTTYSISNTGSGATAYTDASIQLRLSGATQAAPTGVAGQHFVVGDLSVFSSPFKPKLSENTSDSIVWTFNMRYNYNNNLSGFNPGNRGYAVILAADGSDLTTSNGYAVVNGGESPTVGRYRLVKFMGGLDDNANITALVNGITLTNVRDYVSLKVKYQPASKTWTFYNRSDGATAWADPTVTSGYTNSGTSLDETYINTTMTNFGFIQCYAASTTSFVALFDNFKVVASPNTPTSTTLIWNKNINIKKNKSGFTIDATKGILNVFDATGKQIINKHIFGNEDIYLPSKGIYIIRLKSNSGVDEIKFLFQ